MAARRPPGSAATRVAATNAFRVRSRRRRGLGVRLPEAINSFQEAIFVRVSSNHLVHSWTQLRTPRIYSLPHALLRWFQGQRPKKYLCWIDPVQNLVQNRPGELLKWAPEVGYYSSQNDLIKMGEKKGKTRRREYTACAAQGAAATKMLRTEAAVPAVVAVEAAVAQLPDWA